jgi:hypothetical protein
VGSEQVLWLSHWLFGVKVERFLKSLVLGMIVQMVKDATFGMTWWWLLPVVDRLDFQFLTNRWERLGGTRLLFSCLVDAGILEMARKQKSGVALRAGCPRSEEMVTCLTKLLT